MERYLIPNSANKTLTIKYSFLSEGISKKDYDEKRYDITFPNQTMYLNILFDGIEIEGTCFNVSTLENDSLLNLKYEINELMNKNHELLITTKENIEVFKAIIKNANEINDLSEICKTLLQEFEKGNL